MLLATIAFNVESNHVHKRQKKSIRRADIREHAFAFSQGSDLSCISKLSDLIWLVLHKDSGGTRFIQAGKV